MTDVLTAKQRQKNMRAVKGSNTKIERMIRSELHKRGLRFRINSRTLHGTPDLVLAKHKVAVFVHGCFWHKHQCALCVIPRTHRSFWLHKLNKNVLRDRAVL